MPTFNNPHTSRIGLADIDFAKRVLAICWCPGLEFISPVRNNARGTNDEVTLIIPFKARWHIHHDIRRN
jgi:hypothetical protein